MEYEVLNNEIIEKKIEESGKMLNLENIENSRAIEKFGRKFEKSTKKRREKG